MINFDKSHVAELACPGSAAKHTTHCAMEPDYSEYTLGTKLYQQIVGIPMGTNHASFIADLLLFYYERDFMPSLSHKNQANIIEAFNSASRYLDYPIVLQLNKTNISDTEASFLDLNCPSCYILWRIYFSINLFSESF